MSRLRLLFFSLLVLAVPLQGFAATTKALCRVPGAVLHGHAQPDVVGSELWQIRHTQLDGEAMPHTHAAVGAVRGVGGESAAHQCGLCAACCHAVAPATANQLTFAVPLPQAQTPEVLTRIPERAVRLPRKPPRA